MKKEKESKDDIGLSDEEKQLIEAQREEAKKLASFRSKYQELVNETGFAWAVDGNSTLNSPKLGIAKVGQ